MARPKAPKVKAEAPPQVQGFVIERKKRSEITGAPYNPRVMSDGAKKKLQRVLEKLKLLHPLTWNRRTGNLVGGHQRLGRLDAIFEDAGYGGYDYEIDFAVVDLSEKEEIEANIALNNTEAQGEFDIEKLGSLFADHKDLDIEAIGYDAADVYQLFGDDPLMHREDGVLDEIADRFRERVDAQTEHIKGKLAKVRDDVDFYLVAVFKTREDRNAFIEAVGLDVPDNKWCDGNKLRALIEEKRS
ncbi:MAG: hypothetical protein HOW73_43545 [Polyangiaceae bacterium]|nr:hypothetical protein [Polyangiaceae bacterium]